MDSIIDLLIDNLGSIISLASGLIIGFIVFLTKRIKYKTALIEKDLENVKLQEAIINSSFVVCPSCGKKIQLKDSKIYTGGTLDEKESQ